MPQHKRGPWSQSEDQFLLHLVNLHGAHNWVRISATIQTRSPKQCRERFHQNLKPNLNHDPITPEEGVLIEQMVADMGKRWAEIARRLRGRSDNAVKNWWNGGMNRRRRSNNPRRTEMEVRQQPPMSAPPGMPQPPTHHHSLPSNYVAPGPMQHQYFGQAMYQHSVPHQIHVPSNGHMYRHSGLIDTPLPSPSAFSQLSADGAPSLVSDCSSVSGRSPHNGPSPIELPPLAGSHVDRRQSNVSSLRLSNPGSFTDSEYLQPQGLATKQTPNMLQEPFQPHQQHQQHQQYQQHQQHFQQPTHYLPSQPHQMQSQQPLPQYNMQPNPLLRGNYPPQPMQPQPLPSQSPLQLPSIQNLAVSDNRSSAGSINIDPALTGMHTPLAVPSAPTPEGSPRDKMRLSNLTH